MLPGPVVVLDRPDAVDIDHHPGLHRLEAHLFVEPCRRLVLRPGGGDDLFAAQGLYRGLELVEQAPPDAVAPLCASTPISAAMAVAIFFVFPVME